MRSGTTAVLTRCALRSSQAVRLVLVGLVAVALALGFAMVAPLRATAAAGDEIDRFDITYTLAPSGVLHVQETIRYRFANGASSHGIQRYLITREPFDKTQDAVYQIDRLNVSSPDAVSPRFSSTTSEAKRGREEQLRLRIGDPNQTVDVPAATYVISYDVTGAIRSFADYDELSWDATGLDWEAPINSVKITATVPGGVRGTTCFYGAVRSKTPCTSRTVRGVGQFSQSNLAAGESVSIGVKITSGAVADNKPHLEPDGSQLSTAAKVGLAAAGAGGLASLIGPRCSASCGGAGTVAISATPGCPPVRFRCRDKPPRSCPTTPTSRSRSPSHLRRSRWPKPGC